MKKLFALLLVLAAVLICVGCSSDSFVHHEVLDTFMAVRYEGQFDKMNQLAPQEYWDWYKNQGRSIDDLLSYAEGAYYSQLNMMVRQFGEDPKVTYNITDDDTMDGDRLDRIANALTKYGIETSGVKNGRVITVDLTITGSQASDTTEEVYELVTIGEGEYVLYITEDENTFSVSFRM